MDFIVRNLYLSSSEYLSWASEGLISWAVKLLGHVGRIIFTDRILNSAKDGDNSSRFTKPTDQDDYKFDTVACEEFYLEFTRKENSLALKYSMIEDLICTFILDRDSRDKFRLIIILSYKMKTRNFFIWKKDEFLKGMREIRIHSRQQFIERAEELLKTWENEETRRAMWRYCYDSGRSGSKCMESLYAKALVEAFFPEWTLIFKFTDYLDENQINFLTKDQYYSLFDFQKHVNSKADLMKYDAEGAWPTLLDEFVEFVNLSQLSELTLEETDDYEIME